MYEGSILATKGATTIDVPVAVTVAPTVKQNADGSIAEALTFGGDAVAAAQADQLYNNGSIFGANDWGWRQESGDWRFYYFNIANPVADGTLLLSDTTWKDPSVTDLDTLFFGQSLVPTDWGALGLLFGNGTFSSIDTLGGSQNAYLGSGTWAFDTSTGGPEEIVSGTAQQGPNAVVQHGVGFNGDKFNVPFQTTLGALAVNPNSVQANADAAGKGAFDVTVNSSVALGGLKADAFGLSKPQAFTVHPAQDDASESAPSTASAKLAPIAIGDKASRATFTLPDVHSSEDVDLFVAYDANHDGQFTDGTNNTPNEIVGSSTGGAGQNESVTLSQPPAGNYQVGVDIVQGHDLTVTGVPPGAVPANTPVVLHVTFSNALASAEPYEAELLLGPDVAPTAVTVPITINGAPAPLAPAGAPGGTNSAKK
jgi:hypothetical protein